MSQDAYTEPKTPEQVVSMVEAFFQGKYSKFAKSIIERILKGMGYSLRIIFPFTIMTLDLRFDRVNIYVDDKRDITKVELG